MKTAIITGAASGIGLATVKRLSSNSKYNPIYAVDIDTKVREVSGELETIIPVELDVTDYDKTRKFIGDVASLHGSIDLIVNAAGIMIQGLGKMESGAIDRMMATNLGVPIVIMMEALKYMHGGTIINVTSSKMYYPDSYHNAYEQDKRALSRVTKRMHKPFWNDCNVRLVDIQPSNTKTNIDRRQWAGNYTEAEKAVVQKTADWWRQHFGMNPQKVAEVIYRVAEGEINGNLVPIGLDAKIGRIAYNLTYPKGISSDIFFGIMDISYKTVALFNFMIGRVKHLTIRH